MPAQNVTKEKFKRLLENRLGVLYGRAEKVFDDFGTLLSFDVTNVLLHAVDQGQEKVEEILTILENHFQEHLQYQHPDIRGSVRGDFGINKTQVMFLNICQKVLNLQPTQ